MDVGHGSILRGHTEQSGDLGHLGAGRVGGTEADGDGALIEPLADTAFHVLDLLP